MSMAFAATPPKKTQVALRPSKDSPFSEKVLYDRSIKKFLTVMENWGPRGLFARDHVRILQILINLDGGLEHLLPTWVFC